MWRMIDPYLKIFSTLSVVLAVEGAYCDARTCVRDNCLGICDIISYQGKTFCLNCDLYLLHHPPGTQLIYCFENRSQKVFETLYNFTNFSLTTIETERS